VPLEYLTGCQYKVTVPKVIISQLSQENNQAILYLQAKYTDPRTKMRYADAEAFKFVRALPDVSVQAYLSLRNAAVVLK
jgi:hypothetical protein